MKKPLCELCETRHSTWEPHDVTKVEVTKVPPFEQMNSEMQEAVLAGAESYGMPREAALAEFKKMGRPRKYGSHAERQAAYRRRKGPLTPE